MPKSLYDEEVKEIVRLKLKILILEHMKKRKELGPLSQHDMVGQGPAQSVDAAGGHDKKAERKPSKKQPVEIGTSSVR